MPIDNDINPLARRINNPNLKTSVTHDINSYVSFGFKNKSRLSIVLNGSVYTDMIGTRTTYNTKTGAYTYMSDSMLGWLLLRAYLTLTSNLSFHLLKTSEGSTSHLRRTAVVSTEVQL